MNETPTPEQSPDLVLPFVKAPDETPEAFEGFLTFFDLKDRRLQNVAELLDVHHATVKAWSAKFKWRERLMNYKVRLMGDRLQAEAECIKQQSLGKVEQEKQDHQRRSARLQHLWDTYDRL